MVKNKKRNELSIFEDLRLKPDGVAPKIPNKAIFIKNWQKAFVL